MSERTETLISLLKLLEQKMLIYNDLPIFGHAARLSELAFSLHTFSLKVRGVRRNLVTRHTDAIADLAA